MSKESYNINRNSLRGMDKLKNKMKLTLEKLEKLLSTIILPG